MVGGRDGGVRVATGRALLRASRPAFRIIWVVDNTRSTDSAGLPSGLVDFFSVRGGGGNGPEIEPFVSEDEA